MDWVSWAIVALALAAVIVVTLHARLKGGGGDLSAVSAGLKADLERLERLIRDNDSRSFDSAEARGRALREEVAESLVRVTTALTSTLSDARDAQKNQLDTFSQLLGASAKAASEELRSSIDRSSMAQKEQLEAFSKVLSEGVRSIDERLEAVRMSVDQRVTDLSQALTEKMDKTHELAGQHAKSLREEVQASLKLLGDDLRKGAEGATLAQQQSLELVSTNLKVQGVLLPACLELVPEGQSASSSRTKIAEGAIWKRRDWIIRFTKLFDRPGRYWGTRSLAAV
jgi:DNA anti-recombination protein RmuC